MKNGVVVVEAGRIAYAGPMESAPNASDAETVSVPVVMPGMWDCHGHFFGIRTANVEELAKTPLPVLAARIVKDAERGLQAGFTSVREPGGLGVFLARVIDEGTVNGPHVYGAGAALSQTGGHGDLHMYPLDFVLALTEHAGGFSAICDGVPACRQAVRKQLRLGAKLIKVLASGGVASELDHPVHQQFSDEELAAIVEEAARAERIVAAHCHGKPGIMAALRAGCHTIEHGTFLDEESADLMLAKGAILVPTRFIIDAVVKFAKQIGIADYAHQKMLAIHGRHEEALRLAIRKGVRIAVGSDIFSAVGSPVGWGNNAKELAHLVAAGMTPLQAIEAATANGPLTLGPQAPKSGQLKEGYDADILALTKNPIRDIEVVTSSDNITHIWKAGKLVKELPG
ncbi:MAG: amidohydrolase family protein [Euryarchaeota archaeon]|nr:amidohydrolase family protein [Euryarchaeota archaeon]